MSSNGTAQIAARHRSGRCVIVAPTSRPPFDPPRMASRSLDVRPLVTSQSAAAANSSLIASAVELSRPAAGGPLLVSVLLEGSADGVAARAGAMAELLGLSGPSRSKVSQTAPPWWPGPPAAAAG